MMITSKLKTFGASVAVIMLSNGSLAHAEDLDEPVHSLRMATSSPGGPLLNNGAQAFADKVAEYSNGRIEVEVFVGGTLGNALRVSETVRNGVADMGHTWMGYDWGRDFTTVLFAGYPGSMDDLRKIHWLYEGGGVELQREFREEQFGLVSFPLFMRTAEVFMHSRKPVRTLEDMQGLRLRTAGAWLEMSDELGAAPVTTAGGDVFPMLERGAIDAVEWGSPWENVSPGFYRVAKYVIVPGVHQPVAPFELVINPRVWEGFSERDRWAVEEAAKVTTIESWLRVGNEDIQAMEHFKENGNEIIELDLEVQEAVHKIANEWADGKSEDNEWFARVLEHQRDFMRSWQGAASFRTVESNPIQFAD